MAPLLPLWTIPLLTTLSTATFSGFMLMQSTIKDIAEWIDEHPPRTIEYYASPSAADKAAERYARG